jgi:hypothetical protein
MTVSCELDGRRFTALNGGLVPGRLFRQPHRPHSLDVQLRQQDLRWMAAWIGTGWNPVPRGSGSRPACSTEDPIASPEGRGGGFPFHAIQVCLDQSLELPMTLCPIAIVAGCKKCPAFSVCPLKGIIGDFRPEADTPAAKEGARKPSTSAPSGGRSK